MGKILIAEDDLTSRAILRHAVEEIGHSAICSPNGRHAWETLQSNRDIKMLITDVQMAEMDGRDLIRKVRGNEDFHNLPALIISGVVGPKTIADLLANGASLFLPKPLNMEEVQKYIGRCIDPGKSVCA
jgi:CheY-like chemotaxis protein